MPHGLRAGRASYSGFALVLAVMVTLLSAVPAHAATGTLRGVLRDPAGQGFDYFRVELYQASGPETWQLSSQHQVATWTTGLPAGEFSLDVPSGSYRVCFVPLGFEYGEQVGRTCWQGAFDVQGATDLVVADGATTTISPRLPKEASVRGRVVGTGGVGVQAYVQPYRRGPNGAWQEQPGVGTAADGTFLWEDVDPGTYRFCARDVPRAFFAECYDDAAGVAGATEVVVRPGGSPSIVFRLARRAVISGTVTRPPGSTDYLVAAAYHLRLGQWVAAGVTSVAPDGTYRIDGLDADTYRVCVNGYDVVRTCWKQGQDPADASDIVVATGQGRPGIDLAPGRAGFVTGTLPGVYLGAQGQPLVTAWREVAGTWRLVAAEQAVPTGVGSSWTYTIGSLATGSYVVCVEHEDPEFVPAFPLTCLGRSPSPRGGTPVTVIEGATTTGVDIVTDSAGEVRGQVTGTAGPVRVDLYTESGRLALSQTTDAEGRYRFRALPDADYRVAFHRPTATTALAAEWWRNSGDGGGFAQATPITVDGAVVAGIHATLDPGGALTGRVVDSADAPVAGCRLQARAPDGTSLASRTATTAADGSFSVGGLSTADYVLLVPKACTGAPTALYYDADSPTRTTSRLRDADLVAATLGVTVPLPAEIQTP